MCYRLKLQKKFTKVIHEGKLYFLSSAETVEFTLLQNSGNLFIFFFFLINGSLYTDTPKVCDLLSFSSTLLVFYVQIQQTLWVFSPILRPIVGKLIFFFKELFYISES